MRKKLMRSLGAVLTIVGALMPAACSDNGPSANTDGAVKNKTRSAVELENDFSMDLFKVVAKEAKEDARNMCVSPFSVYNILGMLTNGGDESTKDALTHLIAGDVCSVEEVNAYLKEVSSVLEEASSTNVCKIANSIWHDPRLSLTDDFTKSLQNFANVDLFPINPSGEASRLKINSWVNDATTGLIPEFLVKPLDPDIFSFFINALYFKAEWPAPGFSEDKNKQGKFMTFSGKEVMAEYMNKVMVRRYSEKDGILYISLPFEGNKYCMEIFMPEDEALYDRILSDGTISQFNELKSNSKSFEVTLSLPKFNIKGSLDLLQPIKELANLERVTCDRIFDGGDIGIGKVLQRFDFNLNESGVEAAAVTAAIPLGSADVEKKEKVSLTIDHPFIFTVEEISTGTILFIGTVTDPSQN